MEGQLARAQSIEPLTQTKAGAAGRGLVCGGLKLADAQRRAGSLCAERPTGVSKLPPDASHDPSGYEFLVKELRLKPKPFKIGKAVRAPRGVL